MYYYDSMSPMTSQRRGTKSTYAGRWDGKRAGVGAGLMASFLRSVVLFCSPAVSITCGDVLLDDGLRDGLDEWLRYDGRGVDNGL